MSGAYKGGVCAPATLPAPTGLQAPKTVISDAPETGVNATVTPASSLPSDLVIYEEIEEPVTLGALPSNSVTADTGH